MKKTLTKHKAKALDALNLSAGETITHQEAINRLESAKVHGGQYALYCLRHDGFLTNTDVDKVALT